MLKRWGTQMKVREDFEGTRWKLSVEIFFGHSLHTHTLVHTHTHTHTQSQHTHLLAHPKVDLPLRAFGAHHTPGHSPTQPLWFRAITGRIILRLHINHWIDDGAEDGIRLCLETFRGWVGWWAGVFATQKKTFCWDASGPQGAVRGSMFVLKAVSPYHLSAHTDRFSTQMSIPKTDAYLMPQACQISTMPHTYINPCLNQYCKLDCLFFLIYLLSKKTPHQIFFI